MKTPSPRPAPGAFVEKNGSPTRPSTSGGMPGPVVPQHDPQAGGVGARCGA